MSGKPAARQGDMTQYGGSIVQGSAGVRIGAPTGVACSVCPGGVTSGHPVNPLLGAKVLPGETDIALPGPLPFILSRTYSSYRTKTPAPVGSLGPGWKMPADIRLQLRDNTLILSDNGGRSLYFEHLFPGEDGYSRSESLWLVRGGVAKLDEGHRLAALWQALPEELRLSPHRYLATNSPQGPWWLLGWCERVPEADEVLPAPLPPYRVLTGLVDRFGRTQTFHREAAGEFSGEITGVTDGAGRHFRLVLTTQAQRAEEARQQAISGGTEPSAFPDTLPGYTEYGRDNGIRLSAVWLTHDPEYPENLPAAPLVRYGWTPRGELAVVYDRSGKQVRSFTYDDKYRGRMVAHRHTGRPEIRYRYDSDGRVTEQLNPAGLSYTYQYEKDHITITDSLDRREVLHTQGEAGLKGGWNFYQYPLNPVINVDPQGLVDINLYPESDLIHSVADEINIPGVFTIGGHGTPTSIESATRSIMTAKDLAYLIKFDGNYKDGMTVWLFSCNTGKGQNSFASQLAKELHTNVIGPDTLWTWWGRGTNGKLKMDTVLTAPTNLNSNKDLMAITTKDLGNWITYGPSGHPISNMQGTPEKPSDIR
ncbi:RHS repeat protein [Escherichia coli]|nr:DUF6531 domain-containing protein [Escherichia coli]QEP48699.1 RHS repeat protein [Escherichia coli]HAL9319137.1 RHS repeat protein [Escherichia coli]